MSILHTIAGCEHPTRLADVIFVHGLGGNAFTTWCHGDGTDTSWPHWLGQDVPEIGVWSLGYAADPTSWARLLKWYKRDAGYSMPLPQRAGEVLDLMVKKSLGQRPLLFVCHSLGGLLAKQILRKAAEATEPRSRSIFDSTRGVLFLATPHAGAELASIADAFRVVLGATVSIEDLRAHDSHLGDLFDWYRNHSAKAGIRTVTYFETRKRMGHTIVNATSAHPGVGADPVGLDEDHLSIAKPRDRDGHVYSAVRELLSDLISPLRSGVPDPEHRTGASNTRHDESLSVAQSTERQPGPQPRVKAVAPERTIRNEEWSYQFASARIETSIDSAVGVEFNSLLNKTEELLKRDGFAGGTIDNVCIAATELMTNVTRHVPGSSIHFALVSETAPLRYIQVWVGDDGLGFDLSEMLGRQLQRMKEGEREHGLLRVHRLSSLVHTSRSAGFHVVIADVYEKDRPRSVVFDTPDVASVLLQYENPKLLWLGDHLHADYAIFRQLHRLAEEENRPALDCYFAHLSDGPQCLFIEVRGHKTPTEAGPVSSLTCLRLALELQFRDLFSAQKVVFLAADTESFIRREIKSWAEAWKVEAYRDEESARNAVNVAVLKTREP